MVDRYPIVVLANYFQATPDMRLTFKCVQSRMLLWCLNGKGIVTVNAQSYTVAPDDYFVLPWGHAITYQADPLHPYILGGVHIIPNYSPGVPIAFAVAHAPDSPLYDDLTRRDAPVQGCEEIVRGEMTSALGLLQLAQYCVSWFQQGVRGNNEAHMLGTLMLSEIERVAARKQGMDAQEPLHALLAEVRVQLDAPLSLADLAAQAHCSIPTLIRLFQRHLGLSPRQWVMRERMTKAAQLLMTTRTPIGVIGRSVGIDDPYYFSKCFSKHYGIPPTTYRRQMSML